MTFVEWFKNTIHSAYLTLQLVISLVVLTLTEHIVHSEGKSTPDYDKAMVVLAVIVIVVFGSKIIFHLHDTYKGYK